MKKLLLGSAISLAMVSGASAADMYPKAVPAVPAVPYSWTGCYLGAQAGYGWGRTEFVDPTGQFFGSPLFGASVHPNGELVGGQVGCNYQFNGKWVAGLEVADAWADLDGTSHDIFFANKNEHAKINQLGGVTGRLGYAVGDRVLLYGKGGGAWAHSNYDILSTLFGTTTDSTGSSTRFGWTAGAGVEWAFAPSWSTKFEYNHYDLGSTTLNLVSGSGGTVKADISTTTVDTATLGINYHFGR